jgi:hypothetical protein
MGFTVGISSFEISSELRQECIVLFEKCEECRTPEKLRAFASVKELILVRACVPHSENLDYDMLIASMMTTGRSSLEPALFDLLDQLAARYREDARSEECRELKEKLKSALLQSGGADQAKEYQQLIEVGARSEGQGTDVSAGVWIEAGGNDLDELALRITLAVFSGTTFEVIERAKNSLLEMLHQLLPPPSQEPEGSPPAAVIHIPLMRRLEKAGAREAGGQPPDWKRVIELDKPELAGEALLYVWQLYRESKWRQKLIEWLTGYAVGQSADVRMRAAVAVGRLALNDYRFVRDTLLRQWIDASEKAYNEESNTRKAAEYRMAIGMVLGVIAREESLVAEVQNLLWQWSKSPRRAERWAAVRAYIYAGAYCRPVSGVIARWREIATSELTAVYLKISDTRVLQLKNPMYMSLVDAMVQFFASAALQPSEERRQCFTGILEGLREWIAADKAGAGIGLFMFSVLGSLAVSSRESGETDNAPVLLQLLEEQSAENDYRKELAGLFELSLRNASTIVEARELLCAWAGWINGLHDNSQLYEARMHVLLSDIIAADKSGRMRGKLTVLLRGCGSRNRAVERILLAL